MISGSRCASSSGPWDLDQSPLFSELQSPHLGSGRKRPELGCHRNTASTVHGQTCYCQGQDVHRLGPRGKQVLAGFTSVLPPSYAFGETEASADRKKAVRD